MSLNEEVKSLKVIKFILFYKEYNNKDEIMEVANLLLKTAKANPKFEATVELYQDALNRLSNPDLTFEHLMALKQILPQDE